MSSNFPLSAGSWPGLIFLAVTALATINPAAMTSTGGLSPADVGLWYVVMLCDSNYDHRTPLFYIHVNITTMKWSLT
jgi:hypothetical protein